LVGSFDDVRSFVRGDCCDFSKSIKFDFMIFGTDVQHLGRHRSKNTDKGVPDGFFLTSNMHKIHFGRPITPLVELRRLVDELRKLPQTLNRMVKGHPSPRFVPLDALGVSISAHME